MMNQTQTFIPREQLMRGSSKDVTRTQKMTLELGSHDRKSSDLLAKNQKYSQGSLKTH